MTKSKSEEKIKVLLPHEEPLTRDLLLRSQNLTQQTIDSVREQIDREVGDIDAIDRWAVSSSVGYARKRKKASELFVPSDESMMMKKKQRFLEQTTNKQTGKFYSLKNLIQIGEIAESERELFELPPGIDDFPYRWFFKLRRYRKIDGSEWLDGNSMWHGITAKGVVVNIGVADEFYYTKPIVTREPYTLENGRSINIPTIKATLGNEIHGTKTYTTPFTPEVASSVLKLARGPHLDHNNGHSLGFVKEGVSPDSYSIKSIDDFLAPSFEEGWAKVTRPVGQKERDEEINKLLQGMRDNNVSGKEDKDKLEKQDLYK